MEQTRKTYKRMFRNYEKMKVTCTSGKFKTRFANGSYLLLFGKRELQSFEISSYFEISTSFF